MRLPRPLLFLLLSTLSAGAAEGPLDKLDEFLTASAFDHTLRAKAGGTLDLEAYHLDRPTPGLISAREPNLIAPRLTLNLDARLGTSLYGFVKARIDRGFDPAPGDLGFRFDEYALRWTPVSDGRVSLQVGKFATVIGGWPGRHDSWENPFVGAPLPYEHVTRISDVEAPLNPAEFVEPFPPAEKYEYNPVVWGPSYASGFSVGGVLDRFDYAVELKNTGPASRPESWTVDEVGFDHPALAARLGFRPDLRCNLGLSAGDSAYLLPGAKNFPAGTSRGDHRQRLLGQDLGFAWHHWQLWAEVFECAFDVPRVGVVRTVAGYVEAKYKFTPRLYGALRLNRQVFSDVDTPAGRVPWGEDLWRYDVAAGCRFSPHVQLKLQVEYEAAERVPNGIHYAVQLTTRF